MVALRDSVCAAKPGAADEYRLALSARCVPVAGRALEAAERKKRERAAAAAKKRGQGESSAKASASSAKASSAKGAVPLKQTTDEVAGLKKKLERMELPDDGLDTQDLVGALLLARAMSLPKRRLEHPDTMKRFEAIVEKKRVRGAEHLLPVILRVLLEHLEVELRARGSSA